MSVIEVPGTRALTPHTFLTGPINKDIPRGARILMGGGKGKYCNTSKWFHTVFLCYNDEFDVDEHGSLNDPMMGLEGPKFRCYYPNSSRIDYYSILSSGSSGRWLDQWSEKSNYETNF